MSGDGGVETLAGGLRQGDGAMTLGTRSGGAGLAASLDEATDPSGADGKAGGRGRSGKPRVAGGQDALTQVGRVRTAHRETSSGRDYALHFPEETVAVPINFSKYSVSQPASSRVPLMPCFGLLLLITA